MSPPEEVHLLDERVEVLCHGRSVIPNKREKGREREGREKERGKGKEGEQVGEKLLNTSCISNK